MIVPNLLFSKGVSFVFGILFTGIVLADLDIIVTSVVMTHILDLYDSFEPLLVSFSRLILSLFLSVVYPFFFFLFF